jgi:hypothetical protein
MLPLAFNEIVELVGPYRALQSSWISGSILVNFSRRSALILKTISVFFFNLLLKTAWRFSMLLTINSGNSLLTEGEIQNRTKPRSRNCILSPLSLESSIKGRSRDFTSLKWIANTQKFLIKVIRKVCFKFVSEF